MYIRGSGSRAGFSFAEVMFAVVILGIGFIMVAAVFPVAIQQTQSTAEESTAAAIARNAVDDIKNLPGTVSNTLYSSSYTYNPSTPQPALDYQSVQNMLVLPPTVKNFMTGNVNQAQSGGWPTTAVPAAVSAAAPSVVVPMYGPRWDLIKANIISSTDPRYSYVAFYRRESGASMAQVIVISVANRQRPVYDYATDTQVNSAQLYIPPLNVITTAAAFPPGPVTPNANTTGTIIAPDTINVTGGAPQEGMSVLVPPSGSTFTLPVPPTTPASPGPPWNRTYRLGRQISGTEYGPGVFEMEPADNMLLTAGINGWANSGTWSTTSVPNQWVNGGVRDPAITTPSPGSVYAAVTLQPAVAYAILQSSPTAPFGRIGLYNGPANTSTDLLAPPAAATGAFVIVADDYPFDPSFSTAYSPSSQMTADYKLSPNLTFIDNSVTPPVTRISYSVGSLNGRIFRLGQPVTKDSNGNPLVGVYALDPAYGMRPAVTNGPTYSPDTFPNPDYVNYQTSLPSAVQTSSPGGLRAKVFLIGQGVNNTAQVLGGPNGINGPKYSKGAQDIGVFTTYIPVQQ